jgi:Flp pilus assembly protein TadG
MRRARGERGQILAVVVLALVALLGIAAFSIDVGYAYYAKRQLQSATDAAALAGAQDLPVAADAIKTATEYAGDNTPANLDTLTFTYQTKCTATAVLKAGCNAASNPNALVVTGTGTTQTWFAKVFGIDHFNVSAHANACSPCASSPADIVVAIDRTGSMCQPTGANGTCTDLDNAKDGVRTMLGLFSPPSTQIGMVAFPPLESTKTDPCGAPYSSGKGFNGYDAADRGYVTDTVAGGFRLGNGKLNPASGLYLHTEAGPASSCMQSGGNTSYSEALRQAQAELLAHGRPDVPDYIVFLTDGEANIGSMYGYNTKYPPGNTDDTQPCQTAIDLADKYKQAGTTIYSIGYALGTLNCTGGIWGKPNPAYHPKPPNNDPIEKHYLPCAEGDTDPCCAPDANGETESGPITSYDAVKAIASPGNFYDKAAPGDLSTIFASIAADISAGSSRLVDDDF